MPKPAAHIRCELDITPDGIIHISDALTGRSFSANAALLLELLDANDMLPTGWNDHGVRRGLIKSIEWYIDAGIITPAHLGLMVDEDGVIY